MRRSLTSERKEELIERLAVLEHKQWVEWSKNLASELIELRDAASVSLAKDNLVLKTTERLQRWNSFWVSYDELNEKTKEQDRICARKVLPIFDELNMEILSRWEENHLDMENLNVLKWL